MYIGCVVDNYSIPDSIHIEVHKKELKIQGHFQFSQHDISVMIIGEVGQALCSNFFFLISHIYSI